MRSRLEMLNAKIMHRKREDASNRLTQLLADEMCGILQTTNHYYASNLAKNRKDRLYHRLSSSGQTTEDANGKVMLKVSIDDLFDVTHLSNEDQAVYDIHDTLKSYYKVALKRFVDNVVMRAIERHYLGTDGPVQFFTPQFVGALSDHELCDIAGERHSTSNAREGLSRRLERLEQALKLGEEV